MTVDHDARFNAALRLRDAKRFIEAIDALNAIINTISTPKRLVVHSHLQAANVLKKLCRYDEAKLHAQQAVDLSPNFELASLTLFHVLMAAAETLDALKEMVRFLQISDSPKYRDLVIADYDLSPLGPEYGELVEIARAKLAAWQHR